ncbi:uncharacterized protein LOC127700861 isoform X4 [Mytilus californianus]|uniref:uncharacterized protein LOC127700861 isoform X4 n=1 Tax=Mytilus californianus TaxID=6549 RepID=UPI0022456455|nr:uncharacterized protein LOC127700861 isoform X4 [Mytilus californianus]
MDERLKWLEVRINSSLRPRNEDLKNMFLNDENRLAFYEFINNEDVRCLYVFNRPPKQIVASLIPPHEMKYKSIFFLKCNAGTKLTKENIGKEVFYLDCTNIPLEHLELIIREVYLPLLCTNQQNLTTTGGDKVMDVLHRLMSVVEVSQGHAEGRIILSLPSIEVLAEAAAAVNRRGAVLHVLETTVLAWIKQIKGVLRHDPVTDLFGHFGPEPGPLDEIKMWERQLGRLHSILKQLESPVAKDILQNLDSAQSQYSSSFNHVRRDVNKAVQETNRTLKFLTTMRWLFEDFHDTMDPKHMLELFKPMMQVLFLVWQHSVYYHQMDKFHNLLRLLSNEVVHRAISLVGENILREPLQSYSKLKEALRVCAAFRGTYLDFKDKADEQNHQNIVENAERLASKPQGTLFLTKMYGPHAYTPRYGLRTGDTGSTSTLNEDELWTDSPWPPRNAPCFDLLNSFMERCNDVLELVETTRHFRLLADAAEIGGAGSMSLDALVKEIHLKYSQVMKDFFSVVENVLSIDGSQNFERAFFKFRTVVKTLEGKLAQILRISFNQCPTVEAQLRLLEVFEGISGRELVQAHLKDKDEQIVTVFTEELQTVQNMFEANQHNPPRHLNMPPIVSKVLWVTALIDRIKRPMDKIRQVSPHSMEGENGWQMRHSYNNCMKMLENYQTQIIAEWQSNITAELTMKLKQALLIAEEFDEEVEVRPQVIHVNLDSQLPLILREIHYLSQAPFDISLPSSAKEILRNTDSFELRVTATRLETIVSKYNTIMRTITEFEKPLFERKLLKIDLLFESGLQQFTWKMKESGDFIEQAMALVCMDVFQNLDMVQTNCHEIAEITISWSTGMLDVFAGRAKDTSYSMEELLSMQKMLTEEHEGIVVPSGYRIHSLVQMSFEAVQISQASPAWQDYIDYIDAIVLDGLKQATLTSLKSMLNNLVQANMAEDDDTLMPVLTIRLELIDNRVAFRPPLDQSTSVISVQELVQQWLDGYLARGKLVKMLGPKGTYQDYISADDEVKQLLHNINRLVEENSDECKKLIEIFGDYSFLWLQDVNYTFDEFLRGKLSPNPLRSPNRNFGGNVKALVTERSESRSSVASSLNSMAGMSERRAFLTPKNFSEEMEKAEIPALDEFDAEINIYRTARDELQSLEDYHNVGWLRVDLQPIKQVLTTYASKWMWTYTKYLSDQVTNMLENLDRFLKRTEPEIESITGEERDTASFMKMMRLFNEVSAQQSEMDGKFTEMRRTVQLLKKYGQKLPDKTQQLFTAAPGRWNNLKTKVSLAKQRLGPRIQEESVRITQDLEAFGYRVNTLAKELENSDVYNRECNIDEAWVIIDKFSKKLTVLENEAQDLIELQELLETSVVNFAIIPQCRHELNNLKQVWETVRVIDDQQAEWKRHRWQKMNTKFLREETNKQLDIVRALPEDVFTWDVYMGLHESITTIQACLPLIDDLSNPAMRTRHLKLLVRVTGGTVNIDNDTLKRMTLKEFIGLGLQKHIDDVRAIVQKAVKDLAIDQSLKTYDEIWTSKLFKLRLHTRVRTEQELIAAPDQHSESQSEGGSQPPLPITSRSQARTTSRISNQSSTGKNKRSSIASLPSSLLNLGQMKDSVIKDTGQIFLLNKSGPIFEELENHQVALQAMQSSAGSFLDDIIKWQKKLQQIEAVLVMWLEVQDKWIELEEIFSGADVRTSLSHDANRFAVVNRDFRLLMRATEKNPNVRQCCERKNILVILEHMNHSLEQCRRSLLNHLERRRQIFPRFYFLSMEDVLHIVCNGYDLNQVNVYIGKVFENVGSLLFEEVEDNEKYHYIITGVNSVLGERLEFLQPVPCEGQIETWLTSFIQGLKNALQYQMATALGHEKAGPKTRQIRSAGSRKVTIKKSGSATKQNAKDRASSRTGSRQASRQSKKQAEEQSRASSVADQLLTEENKDSQSSWTLDHVAEVVYLATQVQMTETIEGALKEMENGTKDKLEAALAKINTSIKATTLLLKGLEGEKEAKLRKEKTESEAAKSQRDGLEDENASVAGARSSYGGASLEASRKDGSLLDLADTSRTPIIEEETEPGADGISIVEPQTMEPIDTMNITAAAAMELRQEETEIEEEKIDPSELKLLLFPGQIQKLSSLLALLAHLRDFIERIMESDAGAEANSFDWSAQLRYYFNKDNRSITIKSLNADFDYGYEYIGSSPREVITPLTERVFVSLTQAIKSHMGAMCVGPIDCGKFELAHELARSLGHPLYKFSCTNTTDYVMLHDIFRGLASTGCWVSFNNLNHLRPSVLSVFAQLIQSVMDALKAGKGAVHLQSDDIQLNQSGACFALLDSALQVQSGNPDALLLYPSATAALPDYIMNQFRTISIIKPDLHLALEVMLCSQGFLGARELARKTMSLYELYRRLLGTNVPISENIILGRIRVMGCDVSGSCGGWSMKTMKDVVSEAGAYLEKLKEEPVEESDTHRLLEEGEEEEEKKEKEENNGLMTEQKLHQEEKALVMAIRDTFLPRLHGRDASVFATLITDLWPYLNIPMVFGGELEILSKPPPSRTSHKDGSGRIRTARSITSSKSLKDSIPLNTPVVPLQTAPNFLDAHQRNVIEDMQDAIAIATGELNLLPGVAFQARVAQLSQLNASHQTIFVVGPPGCGKSECIKTFAVAERSRGKIISVQNVFTKAVESEELMGYLDQKTKEWKDGLLASILRKFCVQPPNINYDLKAKPIMKIVQMDGESEPAQMELLGAVLNNDGAVVLGNNERIVIADTIRFLWEMESVAHMSPALLANVGVMVMTPKDVGWKLILVQWLEHRPENDRELLTGFCDVYIEKTIEYLNDCCTPHMLGGTKKKCPQYKRVLQHNIENMIGTFCTLLEAVVNQTSTQDLSDVEYERYFNFTAIWSFGGTLEEKYRESFSNWWKEQFEQHIDYPEEGTVFDYMVDGDSHEFVLWKDTLQQYSGESRKGISAESFVHTVSVEQLSFLIGVLTEYGKPVILVGENGCGKSSIINDRIRTVCSGEVAEVLSLSIPANRFTNARLLYDRLDEKLEWKHGKTYVPKGNKKLLCMIDDINLSQVDKWGHQTAIELVREHIDDGGFYNPDSHAWRYIKNVTYISTINPNTTANVPKLSQRFLRHFAVFHCPYPGQEELQTVFSTLLHCHFILPETSGTGMPASHHVDVKAQLKVKEDEEAMRKLLSLIVKVNVELQDRLRGMFLNTAQRCHYIFTTRDLSIIFKNLCLSLQPECAHRDLLLLWQHECAWVYGHRLVTEVDYKRYKQAFVNAVRKEFSSDEQIRLVVSNRQPLFSNLIEQDSGVVTAGMIDARHISNISEEEAKTDLYKPRFNMKDVKDLMIKGVEEYNKIHPRIKLALYKTVVEQVCRLARTIASPQESAHTVLVAEGCAGRCTVIAKLASHLCGYTVFQVSPCSLQSSGEYKMEQFKSDLVECYTRAGSRGEKILLLLNEEELMEEDFLVFLIEFIVSGSISHLFTYEEQTTIINSIRTEVTLAGLTYTRDTAWNFFLGIVRNNFRVCMIACDGGQQFQRRCREYPAFTENVNFLWFPHWSKSRLIEHALYHLKDVEWMNDVQRENIAHMMASMHLVLRQQDGGEKDAGEYRHVTNTSFEKFVERYISLANTKHFEINDINDAVSKSLRQIKSENEVAVKLRKQLEHEMVVLEERKASAVKFLCQIGQDTAITEQQIKVVKAQLEKISKLKKLLPEYQIAEQRAVFKTTQIYGDTMKEVEKMNGDKHSLGELRGMSKPPLDIEDLMAAVIMILKSPSADLTWQKGAKRQMANLERFIDEMMVFDKNQLPESTLNLVEPYLKKASFDPDTLEKKTGNPACGSLCRWVRGVVWYNRMMISKVEPLHKKVKETTQQVDDAEHRMANLEKKRKDLESRLQGLAKSFEEATIDKNKQEEKCIKMKKMLETAAKLRKILKGERQRCQQIYDSHDRRLVSIPGGCAMAAAFCTYLGTYHHNFRRMMLTVHWPNCLRERGVPLVIDSIDGLKGRVIDWSIDFLKTATGASQVYDIDYTSALLGQQGDYEEQAEDEAQEAKGDVNELKEENEEEAKEENEEEGKEKTDEPEKSEVEKTEKEEESGKESSASIKDDDQKTDKTLDKIQEEESSDVQEDENQTDVTTSPVLTSTQYNRYVGSLIKILVGETVLNDWMRKDFGPRQLENAAIMISSWQRPPMLIDPNGEGSHWLGRLNKLMNKRKLVSLDMETRSDPHVILTLEKAIMRGKPVILNNCENHIDNIITPLMHHRNTANPQDQDEEPRMIRFCGRRVLCHQDFRFYLSTPLPKPRFNPEIASTTTMINYGVSHDTLTEDLLTRAFSRMRPELYKEKRIALRNMQLQKDTLLRLSDIVKEKVLTNQEAMLGSAKALTFITDITNAKIELAKRLEETKTLLIDIDDLKDELFPLARRGAMLFAIVRSLQSVHNEYQFSLKYFLELFDEAVGEDVPEEHKIDDDESSAYEDDDESVVAPKVRHSSTSSQGSRQAQPQGDKQGEEKKSEKGDGEYEADFDDTEGTKKQGDSASTAAAQKLIAGTESEELPPLEIPETVPLPSEGLEYSSLSANQIKQVMDKLTGLVYRRIRESLYEEDCLLFATLLCLNIEAEGMENFSNEEMSLLLQGNPGLGMQLTLNDFDYKDDPPTWLPQEKWEDIMALSVLPGPLDSLCVNFAQNSEAWKAWYKSPYPEKEPLPLAVGGESTERRPGSGGSVGNAKTPDLGPMTEFHQLLLLRMLRPDRLPTALVNYVNKHLTLNLPDQSDFNLADTLKDAKRHLGVLLLLPPSVTSGVKPFSTKLRMTDQPIDVLYKMAKAIGSKVEHVKIGEGCEYLIQEAIDGAEKHDGWVIIENLHLAHDTLFNDLKKQLVRVARSRSKSVMQEDKQKGSRFCVWITSEPCPRITDFLIRNLHKVSWSHITQDVITPEGSTTDEGGKSDAPFTIQHKSPQSYLHSAIVSTLKQTSNGGVFDKLSTESQVIKSIAFGLSVIQGMLSSRQLFGSQGLNQWYPFNRVQMEQAIEILTGKLLRPDGTDPKVDKMTNMFAQMESPWPTTLGFEAPNFENLDYSISSLVYNNCVTSESDMTYIEAAVSHVLYNLYQESSGSLVLGSVAIPTPPANVDPQEYGSWYEKNVDEEFTISALQLQSSVEKENNDANSSVFIRHLDHMFETQNMEAGDVAKTTGEINIAKLRSALDLCLEELPNLLELGNVIDVIGEDYDFPYHRPSVISLATAASSQMPETIGYCLLQECLWFNTILCHIRQEINVLQSHLLGGPEALPKMLSSTVSSLQEEFIPISWIHPNCQPCTHSLVSWLEDTKKRHKQLYDFVRHGMIPTYKDDGDDNPIIASGRLTKIWLGGLVNPQALLTSLKQEKAIVTNTRVDDMSFECVVMDDINTEDYEVDEGGLFLTSIYLQGGAWDYDNDSLKNPESGLYSIPCLYLRPVIRSDQEEKEDKKTVTYPCPMFMNKSRQVMCDTLDLNCPTPVDKWKLSRTALILDAGLPEDGAKKSRSYLMLLKAGPSMLPAEGESEIQSEEDDEELQELEQEEDFDANPSEVSQLSYRAITPKAPPLPPGMGLAKEPHMAEGGEKARSTKSSPHPSGKGSPAVQSSPKPAGSTISGKGSPRSGKAGSTVSSKSKGSKKTAKASPIPEKTSRPTTKGSRGSRGAVTPVKPSSIGSQKDVSKSLDNENDNARPRSQIEEPVTQIEIETDTDNEAGGETQKQDKSETERSVKADTESSVKVDTARSVKADTERSVKADTERSTKADTETSVKADTESSLKADTERSAKADTEEATRGSSPPTQSQSEDPQLKKQPSRSSLKKAESKESVNAQSLPRQPSAGSLKKTQSGEHVDRSDSRGPVTGASGENERSDSRGEGRGSRRQSEVGGTGSRRPSNASRKSKE